MESKRGTVGDQQVELDETMSNSPPYHRYNTRLRERTSSDSKRQQHSHPSPINTTVAKQLPLQSGFHQNVSAQLTDPTQIDEDDATGSSSTSNDIMMLDQVMYSATTNPIRAPFPSPAMKSSPPFFPFPPTHGFPYAGGEKQEMSWNGVNGNGGGTCILVEAANRAQMAILVDDMGSMGIEQQMEQA